MPSVESKFRGRKTGSGSRLQKPGTFEESQRANVTAELNRTEDKVEAEEVDRERIKSNPYTKQ